MFTITIELPESINVDLGDTGLLNVVPVKEIGEKFPEVIRFAVCNGFMKALNDVSRPKEDDEPVSDASWLAARQKRIDNAWLAGEWAGKGGGSNGERLGTLAMELYVAAAASANGVEPKVIAKVIEGKVKSRFGKDAKLTVENKMAAIVGDRLDADGFDAKAKDADATRKAAVEAFEAEWFGKAREALAERAKVKVDLKAIKL